MTLSLLLLYTVHCLQRFQMQVTNLRYISFLEPKQRKLYYIHTIIGIKVLTLAQRILIQSTVNKAIK